MRINFLKIIFVVIFYQLNYSQVVELSAVSHSILSGVSIGYQMLDRESYQDGNNVYREHQKKWRLFMPFKTLTAVNIGFAMMLENKSDWKGLLTDAFVVSVIWLNVRPMVYNLVREQSIFTIPNLEYTYFSKIEKFLNPSVNFAILVIVLSFKYFVLPLL